MIVSVAVFTFTMVGCSSTGHSTTSEGSAVVSCTSSESQGVSVPPGFGTDLGYVKHCALFENFPLPGESKYTAVDRDPTLQEPIAWLWLQCGLVGGVVPIGATEPAACGSTGTSVVGVGPG